MNKLLILTVCITPIANTSADEIARPLGILAKHADVGNPALPGAVSYDKEEQTYTVSGAGTNMWFAQDQFSFVYKQMKGDFIVQAQAHFVGQGVNPHRKLGCMIRTNLDSDSPHVNAVVHGDGLTSLQFRRAPGNDTEEVRSALTGADVIQLARRGVHYTMSVARFGEPFVECVCDDLTLGDDVFVGLFVCAHETDIIEKAVFKNVRITVPASPDLVPYREYLGSRLETLDVDTGDRQVLMRTPEGIEAPNWTPDGSTLIYNSRGRLYRFPLADKQPVPFDTGFADHCNNDHVLSFDGQTLGISHQPRDNGGKSLIYTLPATGGTPQQVTPLGPSYLHGWSPDGKYLIYTGQRNGDFDIYRIPVEGGEEVQLTSAKGLDDGSEYSPDGKYIYFNSARAGTMQIWRMRSDGTGQEQMTRGELNDWFPHVSPDGKRVLFLSFSKEIAAEEHPFYKPIYLRIMPIDGGTPKIVAYLYGGQGTINVPSWAPDSQRAAFVSHTN